MFVDELHVEEDELAALITALHRAAQRRLPVVVSAGSQLRGEWAGRSLALSACLIFPSWSS
jgi:hypothetical protein